MMINKNYAIAKCVNNKTLFIACSYSGNTEETVQATEKAIKAGAEVVVISSGGGLIEMARKKKLKYIQIPSGMPPRSCLGYSLVQQLHVMHQAGLLKTPVEKLIRSVGHFLEINQKTIRKKAKQIAKKLVHKKVVTYTTEGYEGLAIRFRQQINENSKQLGWHQVIPEMTHNEIVGWRHKENDIGIVVFKDTKALPKNNKRLDFLIGTLKKYCKNINLIEPLGETYWERAFYHIHLGDWISWELSLIGGFDANEIDVINSLKNEMGEKKK